MQLLSRMSKDLELMLQQQVNKGHFNGCNNRLDFVSLIQRFYKKVIKCEKG